MLEDEGGSDPLCINIQMLEDEGGSDLL